MKEARFINSTNPRLLRQYFSLREESYRVDLGLTEFNGEQDSYDINGDIFLMVTEPGITIAGLRIAYPSTDDGLLPMENSNFLLKVLIPELTGKKYGEFGRIVLDRDYRATHSISGLYAKAITHAREKGISFLFGLTPYNMVDYYKKATEKAGADFEILSPIELQSYPEYAHLKSPPVLGCATIK